MASFAEDHAYHDGREAFHLGIALSDDPYDDLKLSDQWQEGWCDARDEAYEKAKKEAKA